MPEMFNVQSLNRFRFKQDTVYCADYVKRYKATGRIYHPDGKTHCKNKVDQCYTNFNLKENVG